MHKPKPKFGWSRPTKALPPPPTDEEVLHWMAEGMPSQPSRATGGNPDGQFYTSQCFEALARELLKQRETS